jgi:hypothetical protein
MTILQAFGEPGWLAGWLAGLRLKDQGLIPRMTEKYLFFTTASRPDLGPTQPPIRGTGGSYPGGNATRV